MDKKELKKAIAQVIRKHPLCPNVKKLSLFGSRVRGEERSDSDVDLYLEFRGSLSLFDVMGMEQDLEKALGMHVDLVLPSSRQSKYFVLEPLETVYEG